MVGWGIAAVALTGVILSLNRNMLLGLALGLCAAALIAPQKHRFVVMVALLGMVLSGFILLAQGSAVESNAIVSRVASITNYLGAADADARRPLLRERHRAAADPRPSHRRTRLGSGVRSHAPELR